MDWKDAYYVGIHEIDEQHKTLIEHISDVEATAAQHERHSDLSSALIRLSTCAHNHFMLEESLMRIHDYPRLHEHANEHWRFLAELRTLQERALTELTGEANVLRAWWDVHIQSWDKSYALYFLKRWALRNTSSS